MIERIVRAPLALLVSAGLMTACAPSRIALPSGSGEPFPDFASAYATATEACAKVDTLTASLALSGRAGTTKLRGRIDAGFAQPSQMRLDGFPPVMFGARPFFTLVARGSQATLVLPRDRRVLAGAPPKAIVEALAGVALDVDELRSVVSGCGLGMGTASSGRAYPKGWVAIDAAPATLYLRQMEGRWRIAAVTRAPLTIEYADYQSGRPATIHLRSTPAGQGPAADIVVRLSQVEVGVALDRKVFEVDVPADATPIALDELRRAGPLGGAQ